jgi:nicotinate-nucleotide adenylyltransferase
LTARCIVLLGGSFDPVHNAHIAVASFFCALLHADELRVIPAGNPWQRTRLQASAEQRIEMVRLAFSNTSLPFTIDRQEIDRTGATYTIDTLRALRSVAGQQTSLVLVIGADQLQQLDTWHEWRQLFDYAHICVAARPGFSFFASELPPSVGEEFYRRSGSPEQIRNSPHGLTYLAHELAFDISATEIRAALRHGQRPGSLVPAEVVDYIEKNNLYKD